MTLSEFGGTATATNSRRRAGQWITGNRAAQ